MQNLEKYLPEMCLRVPPLGSDIIEYAMARGETLETAITRLLVSREKINVPLTVSAGFKQNFAWVGGNALNVRTLDDCGPQRRYDAMIVGQFLGQAEVNSCLMFSGAMGRMLRDWLRNVGLENESVYLTSLLKTRPLVPKKFLQTWVAQQQTMLMIELLLTRPKYVLSLGSPVTKWFFGKKTFKMQSAEGRWEEFVWDLRQPFIIDAKAKKLIAQQQPLEREEETEENTYRFHLMPCTNPAALEYEQTPEGLERIQRIIQSFSRSVNELSQPTTGDIMSPPKRYSTSHDVSITYPVIRNMKQLDWMLEQLATDNKYRLIGIDGEWQGAHPQNAGSFLRCVQFGWQPGKAAVVHLHNTRGEPDFADYDGTKGRHVFQKAFDKIIETFRAHRLRVAGFYYGADHEWLSYYGLDLMPWYEATPTLEQAKLEGGFPVELAVAALDELSDNNLETVRWRFTSVGDYFKPFQAYKLMMVGSPNVSQEVQQAGYGWIDDEQLYPYAGGDADVTISAAHNLIEMLHSDQYGNNCWLAYHRAAKAAPVVAEIMRVGMPFSAQQCAAISISIDKGLNRVLKRLAKAFDWPDFSVDGWQKLGIALYGRRYSSFRDKDTGAKQNRRPVGSKTLNLEPVVDNGKPSPMLWSAVREAGLENQKTPATSSKAIGILRNSKLVKVRRMFPDGERIVEIPPPALLTDIVDAKSLRHAQKQYVGRVIEIDGRLTFESGHGTEVCDDGYIRCFMSQTKETGRWSAAMPNLHNWPKRKEAAYKKALKELYVAKMRTMVQAPDGYVIVEADYASAELFMLASASHDSVLWDHCQRNLLEESDARFIDPHARLCVEGFSLPCTPNKSGLASLDKSYMREVAKCIAEGEYLCTEDGLVPVETVLARNEHKFVQSDAGITPLLASKCAGIQECYRIETQLGYTLTTTAEHRHYVVRDNGQIEFRETSALDNTDYLLLAFDGYAKSVADELPTELCEAIVSYTAVEVEEEVPVITTEAAAMLGVMAGQTKRMKTDGNRSLVRLGRVTAPVQKYVVEGLRKLFDASNMIDPDLRDATYIHANVPAIMHLCLAAKKGELVPECILTWPWSQRQAYLWGVTVSLMENAREARSIRLPEASARRYQLALQTLGVVTNRTKCSPDGYHRIAAYDKEALAFFDSAYSGLPTDKLKSTKTNAAASMVLGAWANKMAEKYSVSGGPDTPNVVANLQRVVAKMSSVDQEQLQRVIDCINCNLLPVHIARIEPVGLKRTYDFETTEERRRLLFVNGIATHNSVIYGWCYGRQAQAIQQAAKEEGIDITLAEAETLLHALADSYPDAAKYLEEAAARVDDGFLITPMGRVRRRPASVDKRKLSDYRREFKNTPIQGGVADVFNEAAYNLYQLRRETKLNYLFSMQIHDAIIFLSPYKEVEQLCNEVIPLGMCEQVPIRPFRLDGSFDPRQEPKFMGYGINICFRWGEQPTDAELRAVGIEPNNIKRLER